MIADDWLVKYGTLRGLEFTFSRMKLRTKYPRFFENAVESLLRDYPKYESDFHLFFPDVVAAVKDWKFNASLEKGESQRATIDIPFQFTVAAK